MFADELPSHLSNEPPQFAESDLQTVDAIVEEKRKQLDEKLKARESHQATRKAEAANSSATPQQTPPPPTDKPAAAAFASPEDAEKTPEQLEEEAGQQGAFNPETGEINWDCPCLGGMAHGPCGEEFKSAFSCFVYSDQEPKGIECIDKFQGMQDCFRKYPDIYGAEIADEEAAEREAEQLALDMPTPDASAPKTERNMAATPADTADKPAAPAAKAKSEPFILEESAPAAAAAPSSSSVGKTQDKKSDATAAAVGPISEERGVPEKAFDATGANGKQ